MIVPDKKPAKFCDPFLNSSREIPPEAVGRGIFYGFFHANFWLEAVSDVISGADVVESDDMKVNEKFGDSRSNRSCVFLWGTMNALW